VSRVITTIP